MKILNNNVLQSQKGSVILWILIILLLCSSLFAWYLYMQANTDLEKSKKQKDRIQQRYTNKSDELYESWDKLRKAQNTNNQLSKQVESCTKNTQELNKQQQLQVAQINQSTNKFTSCENEKKELNSQLQKNQLQIATLDKKITQQLADNKSKENELIQQCQTNISLEVNKLNECQNTQKDHLLDIEKTKQELLQQQDLLQAELENTTILQANIFSN